MKVQNDFLRQSLMSIQEEYKSLKASQVLKDQELQTELKSARDLLRKEIEKSERLEEENKIIKKMLENIEKEEETEIFDPDDHIPEVHFKKSSKPSTSKSSNNPEKVVEIDSDSDDDDHQSEWIRIINERRKKTGKKTLDNKFKKDGKKDGKKMNDSTNKSNRREDFEEANKTEKEKEPPGTNYKIKAQYCHFYNNHPSGCRRSQEECTFKHESAPVCRFCRRCRNILTSKRCPYFHPQTHFLYQQTDRHNPPNPRSWTNQQSQKYQNYYQGGQRSREDQIMGRGF